MILESKSNACTRDVGRNSVAHSAAQRGRAYSAHAGLSPQPGPWRNLLFHGQFAGPALECSNLLVRHIDALRDAVRRLRTRAPFRVDAWVVLPDHMHCLWSLPEGDADFPSRWRAIKIAVRQVVADRRTAIGGYGQTRRTRYLAAPLLGAHNLRPAGFRPPFRLHPFQSGQARSGRASGGLALLDVSLLRCQRNVSK